MWGLLAGAYLWGPVYTVRPDLHFAVAWFAGLVCLENARLDRWHFAKLALGSFMLTYASGIHYFGALAFTGVVVYAGLALRELGWRAAWPRILGMIGSGCIFGLPYLTLFVMPHWLGISNMVSGVQGTHGVLDALRTQYFAYRYWHNELEQTWRARPFVAFLVLPPLWLQIPPGAIGFAALVMQSSTRGLALAALPEVLFVLLYSQGKSAGYFIPEFILYFCGVLVALMQGVTWCLASLAKHHKPAAVLRTTAAIFAVALIVNVPRTLGQRWAFSARLPDLQVARAAGLQILGPAAFVGTTSVDLWYIAGATHFYLMRSDLLYPQDLTGIDLPRYLSHFDALAVELASSGLTWNRQRVAIESLYATRDLSLVGFYFGRWGNLPGGSYPSYLLLSARRVSPVTGYAYQGSTVYQFLEQPGGNSIFVAAVCPKGAFSNVSIGPLDFSTEIMLPGPTNAQAGDTVIWAFLANREAYTQERARLVDRCEVRDEIVGRLNTTSVDAFLRRLRTDRPIKFYETYPEAVWGAKRLVVSESGAQVFDLQRAVRRYKADFNIWQKTSLDSRVHTDEGGRAVRIASDVSQYSWQLISKPIEVEKHTLYLVTFNLEVGFGGTGFAVVTGERQRTLATICDWDPPKEPMTKRLLFDSEVYRSIRLVISDCSYPKPVSSTFRVSDVQILEQSR
jgi:hypothetical protein